ncbi:MAG: AAA family ATPase [Gammaproteobacteria bacterium]|nr:AAA family ATPase [Gammaproteobacteria bacterium]
MEFTVNQIILIGEAQLQPAGASPFLLERKAAALVAFLALHGPASRSQLAGLLWPDSAEATARNNLSQTMRRLKAQCGDTPLFQTAETLALTPHWVVDCKQLEMQHLQGEHEKVAVCSTALLSGLYYDDCPEFSFWLQRHNDQFLRLKQRSLAILYDNYQRDGAYREALGMAQRLVETEPLSEDAWRRLMQAHFNMDDRAAALNAYQRFVTLLRRELDLDPMPQTQALARDISAGLIVSPPAVASTIPPSVSHPPSLIGRADVWRLMEQAWQKGQAIFLAGPLGVGKTRLAREFLASKGRFYAFRTRPADHDVPYAAHARTYRELLQAFPEIELPTWVRNELARILPELGVSPGPVREAEQKLRFYQAKAEATRLAVAAGMRHVLIDDLHYSDLASIEAGHFVSSQYWGRLDGMRTVVCLQEDLLDPQARQALTAAVETGMVAFISLAPLGVDTFGELLASMGIDSNGDTQTLHQRCDGLPGALVRLATACFESGQDLLNKSSRDSE